MKLIGTLILSSFYTIYLFGQTLPNYVPDSGLVGWWTFSGNALDESGFGNHGAVIGASLTPDRQGKIDSAYYFQNGNSISFGTSNSFSISTASTNTISLWMYAINGDYPFLNKYENSVSGNSNFFIGPTSPFNDPGDGVLVTANGTNKLVYQLPSGQWHHIAVIFKGPTSEVDLYVNGQLVATQFLNFNNLTSSKPLAIQGDKMNQFYNNSNGVMDDIGFWNRALDSCEIKDLFQAAKGNCCPIGGIVSQPSNQLATYGSTAIFTLLDTITNATYQWQIDQGIGFVNLSNAGQFSGTQTDSLIISNVQSINNNSLFRCILSSGNQCKDTSDIATLTAINNIGILESSSEILMTYPNPTNNFLYVDALPQLIGAHFHLFNSYGQIISQGIIELKHNIIELIDFPNGVYYLEINGGHRILKKIVISH